MKLNLKKLVLFTFILTSGTTLFAQKGIGTNRPNNSSALEISSPDKGLLIPRISLTASQTFTLTGSPDAIHNGMVIYNTNIAVTEGLTGEGFYYWTGGATGSWNKLITADDIESIPSGTVTDTTLRWNGSEWVENSAFTSDGIVDGTGTSTLTTNLTIAGNTIANGTLTVTDAITAQSTVTLDAALVDSNGQVGTEGQVLTSTGTSTIWTTIQTTNNIERLNASTVIAENTNIVVVDSSLSTSIIQLTLPNSTNLNEGHEIKFQRKNAAEAGTDDDIEIITTDGKEIGFANTPLWLNNGYQSITLVYSSVDGWLIID